MLTREDIKRIIAASGYTARFHRKYHHSAQAATRLLFNVRAASSDGNVYYLATLDKIAQMSENELRQLIARKISKKVEASR